MTNLGLVLYVALLLACATLPFSVQLALAACQGRLARAKRFLAPQKKPQTKFILLIPAHNEAASIAPTLSHVDRLNYPKSLYRAVVIADNCKDATAAIARGIGAFVIERQHATARVKGLALAYATALLLKDPKLNDWDALVIIDADTAVGPELLSAFDAHLATGRQSLQAYYTVSNPDASWRTGLMTYALALINGSYGLGLDTLGLGAPLRGNGMCFSRAVVEGLPWNAFGLAEDLEYSWNLRLAGIHTYAVPKATVAAEMVTGAGEAARGQRLRWETGRRALRQSFRALVLRHKDWSAVRRLGYLTDLYMPPLARLGAVLLLSVALHTAVALSWGAPVMPLALLQATVCGLLLVYGTSAFWVMELPLKYARFLLGAPFYGLWKLRLLFMRRPKQWIRTPREVSAAAELDPKDSVVEKS